MKLKQYMEKQRISAYMLSEKSGIAQSTISEFINKKRTIRLQTAMKLASALSISVDELINLTKEE